MVYQPRSSSSLVRAYDTHRLPRPLKPPLADYEQGTRRGPKNDEGYRYINWTVPPRMDACTAFFALNEFEKRLAADPPRSSRGPGRKPKV